MCSGRPREGIQTYIYIYNKNKNKWHVCALPLAQVLDEERRDEQEGGEQLKTWVISLDVYVRHEGNGALAEHLVALTDEVVKEVLKFLVTPAVLESLLQ